MNKHLFWLTFFVILLMAAGSYVYFSNMPTVTVFMARKDAIRQSLEETGYVRAGLFYDVQAPVSGQIMRLDVVNGQNVKSGQNLMLLQNLTLETQLARVGKNINSAMADRDNSSAIIRIAQTDFEEAIRDLKRKKSLLDSGTISLIEYETAENNVQKAKDTMMSLQESLKSAEHYLGSLQSQQIGLASQVKQLEITSPIDARILSLPIKKGQIVTTGAPLVTVGTPGRLDVYCEFLSDDAVRIRPSQLAEVRIGGDMKISLKGRVKEIYPQAFERVSALGVLQRRVPVVVTLDENGPLQAGYEVKLAIHTANRDNALIVPREAIISLPTGEESIRIVESGRIKSKIVAVGLKTPFMAEIIKGLMPGDLVIVDGGSGLSDDSKVRSRSN